MASRPSPASWLNPTLRAFDRGHLRGDLLTGLSVGALTIPASLGYAQLAGLPPVYGLYAALAAMVVFGLFGSSHHIVLGPDAAFAGLVGATLAGASGHRPAEAAALAPVLAVMVGVLFIVFGLLRIGKLASFLSRPLLAGFMTGLAVTIIVTQAPKILGVPAPSTTTLGKIADLWSHLGDINWWSFTLGGATIAIALVARRLAPRLPAVVVLLVVGTFLAVAAHLDEHGVAELGDVPSGLPGLSLPSFGFGDIASLLGGAASLAILGMADLVLESRQYARLGGYQVDPNRDLVAAGAANLAASVVSGYPIGASASRSVTALVSGGRSSVVSLSGAAVVALTLLLFSPALSNLPLPVLAGVVIAAASRLIAYTEIRSLWPSHRIETLIALAAALGVIVAGVLPGVGIALALSLLDVVRRAAAPHDAVLGRRPGKVDWYDVKRFPGAIEVVPGMVVYRFDAPLFFANAEVFRSRAIELVEDADPPVRWFVLHAPAVTDIDATAAEVLTELASDFRRRHIRLAVTSAYGPLRDRIARHDGLGLPDDALVFRTIDEAVAAFKTEGAGPSGS